MQERRLQKILFHGPNRRQSGLEKLRELTKNLPPLVVKSKEGKEVVYGSEEGSYYGYGIFKDDEVAVQRVFMAKGEKIPEHAHREKEFGVVYKGGVRVKYGGKEKDYYRSDWMIFEPNELHSGVILENCWMILLTIPPAEDYPDDK